MGQLVPVLDRTEPHGHMLSFVLLVKAAVLRGCNSQHPAQFMCELAESTCIRTAQQQGALSLEAWVSSHIVPWPTAPLQVRSIPQEAMLPWSQAMETQGGKKIKNKYQDYNLHPVPPSQDATATFFAVLPTRRPHKIPHFTDRQSKPRWHWGESERNPSGHAHSNLGKSCRCQGTPLWYISRQMWIWMSLQYHSGTTGFDLC